jgi:hypothetical protein
MTVLAHAGSLVQTVLYLALLGFLVVVMLRTKRKDRPAGDEEPGA